MTWKINYQKFIKIFQGTMSWYWISPLFPAWPWHHMTLLTWGPFQYKDHLSRYGDCHVKDKTMNRPYYIWHGNLYTGKTASLYWHGPLFMVLPWNAKVIMMTTVSSLAVSEDAIMTAFYVTGDFEFLAQMLCFSVCQPQIVDSYSISNAVGIFSV